MFPSTWPCAPGFGSATFLCFLFTIAAGCGQSKPSLVLYCAQDREFAEQILSDFTKQDGLPVVPRFDTEANKSVSLFQDLLRERERPRCDVFWNNEILSTIRLQRAGLLEPYPTPVTGPFPAFTKSSDHTWQAFAARARILLINTERVSSEDRPKSLLDLTKPRWKGKAAMAKPEFGTSATQAACLFAVLGQEEAERFYRELRLNGVAIVPGNKQVAEGVGRGQFDVGITDTDDALAEVAAGRPVVIIYPDRDRSKDEAMGTLFIPNSVAIIRGCPHPDSARRLYDFLLSPDVEKQLAESDSHQIPLNPNVKAKLPPQMETPATVKAMDVDFGKAADIWDSVQTFLRNEFGKP